MRLNRIQVIILAIVFSQMYFLYGWSAENASHNVWNFDADTPGELPEGFLSQAVIGGSLGFWKVIEDKTAPSAPHVLVQASSENPGHPYNVVVIKDRDYADIQLEVRFKALSGRIDRGGGPVWRYQDANNYYIARANPLENNFRVYKVVDGIRRQMGSVNLTVTSAAWHSIKIMHKANEIQCYYDGRLYLEVHDSIFLSGKIGLWTKADAVTAFDSITVEEMLP